MFNKILSGFLAITIFTAASGVSAFARGADEGETGAKTSAAKAEKKITKKDFTKPPVGDSGNEPGKSAYSRAEYERQKALGSKFSTTTKVLIGVGIAAAVIGIVVFAASRDKVRTF